MAKRGLPYKVYDRHGKYMAGCREVEAAAAVIGTIYAGGSIRYEHTKTVWKDGVDGNTGNSYDVVAEVVRVRVRAIHDAYMAKLRGGQL